MKKIIFACVLLIIASAWLPAQSLTITSPAPGGTWTLGSAHTITWTFKGIPDSTKVRLVLYRGSEKIGVLAASVKIGSNGSGSWTWSSAGDHSDGKAVAGSGYRIRVRDTANAFPAANSGDFTLGGKIDLSKLISHGGIGSVIGLVNDIQVSMPAQGLQAKPGNMLHIKWNKAPIATYPQVKFGVYLPDRKTYIGTLHKNDDSLKPNTGDFQGAYVLYERYELGKEYVIRVATPDEKFMGFSGVFRVIPLDAVPLTETFTGSSSVSYPKIVEWKSPVIGCFYSRGEAPTWPPSGYTVGWTNTMEDPAGPCWKYIGHVYRTIVDPPGIYQGFEVTKAMLRFNVLSYAKKQAFYVLRRDAAGRELNVPATLLATIDNWVFGHTIEVDVTATVQAWCTGQAPNHGLIIRGGDESFAHNNTNALCAILAPELVITRTEYK